MSLYDLISKFFPKQQETQPGRRNFLKAATVGAATSLWQFIPSSAPEIDQASPHPKGLATETLINMALLNLINEQFAHELTEFKSPGDKLLVNWRKDHSLAVVDCGNGVSRAFKRVHVEIDENTGGKAIAFHEVDIKAVGIEIEKTNVAALSPVPGKPIRVLFPGMSDTEDNLGTADKKAVVEILEGGRSPQIPFIEQYVTKTLAPYLANVPADVEIQLFGHSLGGPNALHAKHSLANGNIPNPVKAILFEPLAVANEAHWLLKDAKVPDEAAFIDRLASNVSTIRSHPATAVGELYLGNTVANKAFGQECYVINHGYVNDPKMQGKAAVALGTATVIAATGISKLLYDRYRAQAPKEEPAPATLSRRAMMAATGSALLANTLTYVVGKFSQDEYSANHDTAANACKLSAEGDAAMSTCRTKNLVPTLDELRTPERYASYRPDLNLENTVAKQMMRP